MFPTVLICLSVGVLVPMHSFIAPVDSQIFLIFFSNWLLSSQIKLANYFHRLFFLSAVTWCEPFNLKNLLCLINTIATKSLDEHGHISKKSNYFTNIVQARKCYLFESVEYVYKPDEFDILTKSRKTNQEQVKHR